MSNQPSRNTLSSNQVRRGSRTIQGSLHAHKIDEAAARDLFKSFGHDEEGYLDASGFMISLHNTDTKIFSKDSPTPAEVKELLQLVSSNGDGKVSLQDWLHAVEKIPTVNKICNRVIIKKQEAKLRLQAAASGPNRHHSINMPVQQRASSQNMGDRKFNKRTTFEGVRVPKNKRPTKSSIIDTNANKDEPTIKIELTSPAVTVIHEPSTSGKDEQPEEKEILTRDAASSQSPSPMPETRSVSDPSEPSEQDSEENCCKRFAFIWCCLLLIILIIVALIIIATPLCSSCQLIEIEVKMLNKTR